MMPSAETKAVNPFYVLLVVVGVVFCLTACAFGVMTVKDLYPASPQQNSAGGVRLLAWLDQHGARAMLIELAVLAAATFAAITTDEFWTRRKTESHAD